MIDNKILKFLYTKKHNGDFHDVSLIFNVTNTGNYLNEIEDSTDFASEIESQKNSKSKIRLRIKLFKKIIDKDIIDKTVIALEKYGFVTKLVEGYLPFSALAEGDDPSNANNSICKITPKGIEYYENYQQNRNNKIFSFVSLIFSFIALIISIFAIYLK